MTNSNFENYDIYRSNITINNCNARLNSLYNIRDNISKRINRLISLGYNIESTEAEYNYICDIIDTLCKFRRKNPGCLLEGDPGYVLN